MREGGWWEAVGGGVSTGAVRALGLRGWHLAGDEVLAHRQGHLDGVGLVGDGGGIELDLPGAMPLVGLVHGLAEHLLVLPRAQHRADVDDLGVAGGAGEGAGEKQG